MGHTLQDAWRKRIRLKNRRGGDGTQYLYTEGPAEGQWDCWTVLSVPDRDIIKLRPSVASNASGWVDPELVNIYARAGGSYTARDWIELPGHSPDTARIRQLLNTQAWMFKHGPKRS